MKQCAAIQMVSGPDAQANLQAAGQLIAEAAAVGAELMVLPENFALMGLNDQDKLAIKEADGHGPIQDFLAHTAKHHGVWIIGGTLPIIGEAEGKVRAACLVYDHHGKRVARYDKIHLFDVSVPGTADVYRESATIEAGQRRVIADTPFGRIGLAVCYDLRFPELYRSMLAEGVDILVFPSAFTAETGAAHWEVLLRARAIENLCYVIAPNQGGSHANGRKTYGNSMVVDPWGIVTARCDSGSGFALASLDPSRLAQVRGAFPALSHTRFICG